MHAGCHPLRDKMPPMIYRLFIAILSILLAVAAIKASAVNVDALVAAVTPAATNPKIPGALELDKAFEARRNKNESLAKEWFEKAKAKGNIEAEYQIYILEKYPPIPHGGLRDDIYDVALRAGAREKRKSAAKTLLRITRRSAEQGNVAPATRLWDIYYRDSYVGIPPDMPEAIKWLKRAAELGDPGAEDAIGQFYERGPESEINTGLPKDLNLARHWYERAASHGGPFAKDSLARFDSENQAVTFLGFIRKPQVQLGQTTQEFSFDQPVTLGGMSHQEIQLCPVQKIDRFMPYTEIRGRLQWQWNRPALKVDSVKVIEDQGRHLVEHLTRGEYVPDEILIKFKEGVSKSEMDKILMEIGFAKSQSWSADTFSVKLKRGLTVKKALEKLVNHPAIDHAGPNKLFHLD
jgi:TPR repeat protein